MKEMQLISEHICKSMITQNIIFINQRWQNGKGCWFLEIEDKNMYIVNEIKYCPYCGVDIEEAFHSIRRKYAEHT